MVLTLERVIVKYESRIFKFAAIIVTIATSGGLMLIDE